MTEEVGRQNPVQVVQQIDVPVSQPFVQTPVVMPRQTPMIQKVPKTLEAPRVSSVQKVQKMVQMLQIQIIVVDVPDILQQRASVSCMDRSVAQIIEQIVEARSSRSTREKTIRI